MKRFLIAAAVAVITVTTFNSMALAADVGVSLNFGQPSFYGRLNIGDYPRPQVIYRQPRAIQRVPMNRPPIYMRVPPGHARKWSKHCGEYNACGERVLFVRNNWYQRQYVPRYQKQQRDRGNGGRGEQGNSRNDDRGEHGNGNNRGHGRDR